MTPFLMTTRNKNNPHRRMSERIDALRAEIHAEKVRLEQLTQEIAALKAKLEKRWWQWR